MAIVTLRSCTDYEIKKVRNVLISTMEDLGGINSFIHPGETVLLKPNLLAARRPELAVTTHPAIVQVMAEMVLDCGGKPFIADSPGIDPFDLVKKKSGMEEVGKRLNIPVVPLTKSTEIKPSHNSYFRKIELSQQAIEADRIINLPKLKTHCQMTLTMGVKNLFGTVVAQRKAEWHYKVGLNRARFALLLLEIWQALKPDITVMDGIWGMDGHGPSNGNPKKLGLIAASNDALAMDLSVAKMMGVRLNDFPLYTAASKGKMIPENTIYRGDMSPSTRYRNISIPQLDSLSLLPAWMDSLSRSILTSRPVQIRDRCIGCRKCVDICPADAIKMLKDRKLSFDYNKCIRCYCCHEMCPANAIDLKRGAILALLDFAGR